VLVRHGAVRAAYLYGSAARGGLIRDIDIGLVVEPKPSEWGIEAQIAAELADAAELHDASFDVRILNGADPVFLGSVLRDAALIYQADRDAREVFEARAMSLWLDFRPAWERTRREVLRRWAR
jgi:predicted nucleotidyltransferase